MSSSNSSCFSPDLSWVIGVTTFAVFKWISTIVAILLLCFFLHWKLGKLNYNQPLEVQ